MLICNTCIRLLGQWLLNTYYYNLMLIGLILHNSKTLHNMIPFIYKLTMVVI